MIGKSKNYTKLHGYDNEKSEDNLDLENDSEDDNFFDSEENLEENDDIFYNPFSDTDGFGSDDGFGSGSPFGMPSHMGGFDNCSTKRCHFFNREKKPDFMITYKDVENAGMKGFLTGLVTGIISVCGVLILIKHIISKH